MPLKKLQIFSCSFMLSVYLLTFTATAHAVYSEKPSLGSGFYFTENKGQITDQHGNPRPDIDFKISSNGVDVFIGNGQIHYQWTRPVNDENTSSSNIYHSSTSSSIEIYRMDATLIGANKNVSVVTEGRQPFYERYYVPQCPEGAIAYAYEKLTYIDIYPGIDWVLYIKGDKVEQDFVVHPEGKYSDIKMQYSGATSLNINEDGSFTASTPFGNVSEATPYSFQKDNKVITSMYKLQGNVISFEVESYYGELTIDPSISWTTYYGGGQGILDQFSDLQLDGFGSLYAIGTTSSTSNIATIGAYQTNFQGGNLDAFIAKFRRNGNLVWATYYGGIGEDQGFSLVSDSMGSIYIAGATNSATNITTLGSHQDIYGGNGYSVFLVKFDSIGVRQWGTYYGGSSVIDNNDLNHPVPNLLVCEGYLYVCGGTDYTDGISTNGVHQETFGGGKQDAFLAKFNFDGVRQWGTYYGGELNDGQMCDVSCDPFGNLYLYGSTESESNISTIGSHQELLAGGKDHFLAKFNAKGQRLWGTYYGGSSDEPALIPSHNVGIDEEGNIYIAGITMSTNGIASPGSHQDSYAGTNISDWGDAYLVKFDSSGVRQWGTYFGGSEAEAGISLNVNSSKSILISGNTLSTSGIVTNNALQSTHAGGFPHGDAFLAWFDGDGNLKYASYHGGSGSDVVAGLVKDDEGFVYLSGATNSIGLGTSGSHQDTYPGNLLLSPFLTRFCFAAIPSASVISGSDTVCRNSEVSYSIDTIENAESYIWTLPSGWTGSSDSNSILVTVDTLGGSISVQVIRCDDTSEVRVKEIYVLPSRPPMINVNGFVLSTTLSNYISYQWCLYGIPIPGATGATYTVVENGDYTVITIDDYGCVDTSEIYKVNNVSVSEDQRVGIYVNVYPNPVYDYLHIESPLPVSISLNTLDGRTMLSLDNTKIIDIRKYVSGIYLLRITDKEGRLLKVEKVVKVHP